MRGRRSWAIGLVLVAVLLVAAGIALRERDPAPRAPRNEQAPSPATARSGALAEGARAPVAARRRPGSAEPPQRETLTGIVIREDGVPLPGLALELKPMKLVPLGLVAEWQWTGEHGAEILTTSTDDRGAFEVIVPGELGYGFRTTDPRWILRQSRLVSPRDPEARLIALPARSIAGTIVDAATGALLPKASVILGLTDEAGNRRTIASTAYGGRVSVKWRAHEASRDAPLSVNAAVTAPGYSPRRTRLRFEPDGSAPVLDVRLDPLPAPALFPHLLEVLGAQGRLVDLPLAVSVAAEGGAVMRYQPAGPGRLRVQAPKGRHTLIVTPDLTGGSTIRWEGTIDFQPGREDLTRCRLPPFGVLIVDNTDGKAHFLSLDSDAESIGVEFFPERIRRRFALAAGEWLLTIDAADDAIRRLTLRDGEELRVELRRE